MSASPLECPIEAVPTTDAQFSEFSESPPVVQESIKQSAQEFTLALDSLKQVSCTVVQGCTRKTVI